MSTNFLILFGISFVAFVAFNDISATKISWGAPVSKTGLSIFAFSFVNKKGKNFILFFPLRTRNNFKSSNTQPNYGGANKLHNHLQIHSCRIVRFHFVH